MDQQLIQTPSQTVGPYFAYALTAKQYGYEHAQFANGNLLLNEGIMGERITIKGRIFDGENKIVPDAMVEIWQADAMGNFDNPSFSGFGRQGTGTDKDGYFVFDTVKPGSVDNAAPYITFIVFMRGLLLHAYTRMYFSDEAGANSTDEILNQVPAERRSTLVAQKAAVAGKAIYLFDIRMQGENETVFFDI